MDEFKNNKYFKLFNELKENQYNIGNSSYKDRILQLNNLKKAIETTYRKKIQSALFNDFKKPFLETDLTEIYPITSEIKHVETHLKSWMSTHRVSTPITLVGASSWYKYESKGVCLIMSPWNFPLNLTFRPLVSAIAAGNTVILNPSEITPHISAVMKEIVSDLFKEDEIILIEGDIEDSKELLKLPFNHIYFTGSSNVGKKIMKAAAINLTSITLELGGKSPTIIDESANLNAIVKKIAWGKFLNNGQVCVSPDYILLHETIKEKFIKKLKSQLELFYSDNSAESKSYCRIVNNRHYNRLINHITDAKIKGATIEFGGDFNEIDKFISPTLITNLSEDSTLLSDEIFGPILPIISYSNLNKAIEFINTKEKPLALYIYSKNTKNINQIINNTRAGSTCINNNVVQYSNTNLPFGGSNNSGIGKSHGFYGFKEFSNQRSFLKQHTKGILEFLFPPYNSIKQILINLTIKWF